MNPLNLSQFSAGIQHNSFLKELWEEFSLYFNQGQVKSREDAHLLFSKALKITRSVAKDERLKELWLNLLNQGSFSLFLEGEEPINYRFSTIIDLARSGKDGFEMKFVEVDAETTNQIGMAEAIHVISLEAFGHSPGVPFFNKILTSENTFCLFAQERETVIACAYGTYVKMSSVNLFHFNFLARRIEYPSIHILENISGQIERIRNKFPHVQYLTLCVQAKNEYMIPIYQGLGFQELAYIEKGFKDEPMFFYGKQLDKHSNVQPSVYQEFKAALELQKKKESEKNCF